MVKRSQAPAFAPPSVLPKRLPSTFRAPSEVALEQFGAQPLNSRHLAGGPKYLPSTFRAPSVRLPSAFAIRAPVLVDRGENTSEARLQPSYLQIPLEGPLTKPLSARSPLMSARSQSTEPRRAWRKSLHVLRIPLEEAKTDGLYRTLSARSAHAVRRLNSSCLQ